MADSFKKSFAMGQKVGSKGELQNEFVASLKDYLDSRGYRADLKIINASKKHVANKPFPVEICYNPSFEFPEEQDLMALVSTAYPEHQIDWNTVEVDSKEGTIVAMINPSEEVIPLRSVRDIPSEFRAVGTGIFKRQADASGKAFEIWELKKSSDGLALIRRNQEAEIVASDDNEFKAGDVVNTPEGPGKLLKFDDAGNAFVQVGSRKRLVAADVLKKYDFNSEKGKLLQYYTEIYGEEYAQELVKQYGDKA